MLQDEGGGYGVCVRERDLCICSLHSLGIRHHHITIFFCRTIWMNERALLFLDSQFMGDFRYDVFCVGERGKGRDGEGERMRVCVCACMQEREGEILFMRMYMYKKRERPGKGEQER